MPSPRRKIALSAALAVGAVAVSAPVAHTADPHAPETFVPIGGGYALDSLQGFAREVIDQATGTSVDLLVVPSAYGDAPEDRADNLRLAQERADQIAAACDGVVDRAVFPDGCTAVLLPLLTREDALDPTTSEALGDPDTDGVYILGGDQVLAMQVLANTPAEEAMALAFTRGVVVGGTSAGNAVESRSMGAGYPSPGYPWNALERDMSLIFWGDDLASEERGLSFGSERVILDQHFYERGRFGRLLSWVGQSMERYGEGGKLGVGVDWGTSVVIEDDVSLTRPFGASSNAVIDASRAGAPSWVGPRQTLSVQGLLTHLMAPGVGMTYDVEDRELALDGEVVPVTSRRDLPSLAISRSGSLWLGGGDNDQASSAAMAEFVAAVQAGPRGAGQSALLIVATGYADRTEADQAVTGYRSALTSHGWTGPVQVVVHGVDTLRSSDVARAAGVLVIGGDQSLMAEEVADPVLGDQLAKAVQRPTPVMTDGAATAIMGQHYVIDQDPTTADEAIEMFMLEGVSVADGLGILAGWALEPTLTYDYRWGRLYGAAYANPSTAGLGISELTAIRVDRNGAKVVGERSVIAVDGQDATWLEGSNGAVGAVNVWMDVFAVGDRIE